MFVESGLTILDNVATAKLNLSLRVDGRWVRLLFGYLTIRMRDRNLSLGVAFLESVAITAFSLLQMVNLLVQESRNLHLSGGLRLGKVLLMFTWLASSLLDVLGLLGV